MIGLQICKRQCQVAPAFVEKFRSIPVAGTRDCMARITAGGPRLRPVQGSGRLAGRALTVNTRPGDNLMIHKAIDLDGMVIQAGDLVPGSADGVLCVPCDDLEALLEAATAKVAAEVKTLVAIVQGRHDTSWVDLALQRIGCDTQPR